MTSIVYLLERNAESQQDDAENNNGAVDEREGDDGHAGQHETEQTEYATSRGSRALLAANHLVNSHTRRVYENPAGNVGNRSNETVLRRKNK